MIWRMGPDEITRNWRWIEQLLAPTLMGGWRTIADVKNGLLDGSLGIASVHETNAAGVVVLEPGIFGGKFELWIPYMAGRINLKPKAWVKLVRDLMGYFETMAKECGCTGVRIGGRDYSYVFPEFMALTGVPNGLRKGL